MKTYNEFINEEKQVGTIYHYTSLQNFFSIIKDDELLSTGPDSISQHFISFTRNKNLHKNTKINSLSGMTIAFEVDGTKLSNKYKIHPINFFNKLGKNKHPDEDEERLEFDKQSSINPLSKYINKILIVKSNFEKQIEKIVEIQYKKYNKNSEIVKVRGGQEFTINLTSVEKYKKTFFDFLDKNNIKYQLV